MSIREEAKAVVREVIEKGNLSEGQILVVGCSSSAVGGSLIGTDSNVDTAAEVFDAVYEEARAKGIILATQCCEHLNRAIIVDEEEMKNHPLGAVILQEKVSVVPKPKAGGSFSTKAYETFEKPVALEHIKADAGIDIGGVLIGMHLKEVAVPIKLGQNKIGEAIVLAAYTRPKYIGGERAHY